MKKLSVFLITIASCTIVQFYSCKPDPPDKPPFVDSWTNRPPVADAGPDQSTYLPKDSIVLDGRASLDPDGEIFKFQWSKVAGPSSYVFTDSVSAYTSVTQLVEGTYYFELTVTDKAGATAQDRLEVRVYSTITTGCDGPIRPLVNVTLTQIGTLSQPRIPYVAAAGSKIVFAGGPYINGSWYYNSAAVDIYDINSKSWSTALLSKEREGIAAISCGSKIFFAGGGFWEWAFSNIDIYDVSTDTWTRSDLSIPRSYLAAATVGNKVFFAGGFTDGWVASSSVDIYDLTTDTWTIASLSQPRYSLSAVTVGDKIYFAGGDGSNQVDIYNNSTNSWSTSTLQELSGLISGVAFGNTIYWGGINQPENKGQVEIWNTSDGSVTFNCLNYPRYSPTALATNDDVVFFTSADWGNEIDFLKHLTNQIDIYNTVTQKWSVGILPHPIVAPGIISVNNSIYMGGGRTGEQYCTDKVYILNW